MRSKGKDLTWITSTAGINEMKAHLKIEFQNVNQEKLGRDVF